MGIPDCPDSSIANFDSVADPAIARATAGHSGRPARLRLLTCPLLTY